MKTRLLVLGMLHRGDLHPYEIKRRLDGAMVECYLDVDVGTLYYAIRQLEKDGLILAIAQERAARGGMRTIYSITPKGRSEFKKGFLKQFEEDGPVSQTLYGALLFLHTVERSELEQAVRHKIARLDELIAKLKPIREEMAPLVSTGGEYLFQHLAQQRQLDRRWLKDLLADIEAGHVYGAAHMSRGHSRRPVGR